MITLISKLLGFEERVGRSGFLNGHCLNALKYALAISKEKVLSAFYFQFHFGRKTFSL